MENRKYTRRETWPTLYKITNTITGDFYIGSAWRPMGRMRHHWRMLKTGRHANRYLQRAADKYGWWNFEFQTIRSWRPDELSRETLYRLEQQYIDTLNPQYNICRIVNSSTMSEEGKEKLKQLYSKQWVVTSPDGEEQTITNLKQFCRENGLAQSQLWYVAQGKMGHSKGWKCRYADGSTPNYVNKAEREYLITTPNGEVKQIRNLARFCRDNGLSYAGMMNVLTGSQNYHKGYKITKIF